MTQALSDLEQLHSLVEAKWSSKGSCLLTCMNDIWRGSMASYSTDEAHFRKEAMRQALNFPLWGDLYRWNDQEGRTKQEVLDRISNSLGAIY